MSTPSEDSLQQNLLQDLVEAVHYVAEELDTLSKVLDGIRSDLQAALQDRTTLDVPPPSSRPFVVRVTSMPKDPRAPDFGKRLNRYSAADVLDEDGELIPDPPTPIAPPGTQAQRGLFDDPQPSTSPIESPLPSPPAGVDAGEDRLRKLNHRQLRCQLRDARRSLAHNGKRSFAGKEAKKELTALEQEFHRRGIEIPPPGQEVTK